MTAAQKITRARTQLLLNHPFFGTLALRLEMIAQPEVGTMAVDGRHLFYAPAFVDGLAEAELIGVLAHEVMHCALAHHCRRNGRDLAEWNVAADYAINPLIVQSGLKLPADALIDPEFEGLSAEEIYSRRRNRSAEDESGGENDGQGQGGQQNQQSSDPESGSSPATPGGFGQVLDAPAPDDAAQDQPASEAELAHQEREWKIAAEQSARTAAGAGKLPGGIDIAVTRAKQPRVDWRAVLRQFIAATTPSDYSWTVPNRRYVAAGVYLPSTVKEGIGEIVVAVDTSGSISDQMLSAFSAELNSISQEAKPQAIHVVYCDTRVNRTVEYGADEEIELVAQGRGGTDFRPPFAWVEESGISPKCLIYLTDLDCSSYPAEPEYPVLWATDSPIANSRYFSRPPFGDVVYMEPEA